MKKLLILMIDIYSICLAPYIPTECRYHPTCSHYMKESIEKKGVLRGVLKGMKRILRCNPFCAGGYDPVQ
jgi:putative membrane protein insertion efficiency factor